MPIKLAAKKALKQSLKRSLANAKMEKTIKDLTKKAQKLIGEKNIDQAKEAVKSTVKLIDKAVQKEMIKLNTGSRKKSRLVRKLNQILKTK